MVLVWIAGTGFSYEIPFETWLDMSCFSHTGKGMEQNPAGDVGSKMVDENNQKHLIAKTFFSCFSM